jgi:Flp pilus assembly protein TadB
MATVAMMVGGAIINALAFSGSNYLFSKVHTDEMNKHNLALEQLAKEREEYEKKRQERLDFINDRMREMNHSEQTFSNVDEAMEKYYELTGKPLPELGAEPKLDDFYTVSDSQKILDYTIIVGGLFLTYYIAKSL